MDTIKVTSLETLINLNNGLLDGWSINVCMSRMKLTYYSVKKSLNKEDEETLKKMIIFYRKQRKHKRTDHPMVDYFSVC